MSHKSNISLSTRALFYSSRKNTLQQNAESGNTNVVKKDLFKHAGTDRHCGRFRLVARSASCSATRSTSKRLQVVNSRFPNSPELCSNWPQLPERSSGCPRMASLVLRTSARSSCSALLSTGPPSADLGLPERSSCSSNRAGGRLSTGSPSSNLGLRNTKVRVWSKTFEGAEQPNQSKGTSVTTPPLKDKVSNTQLKSNQHTFYYLRRLFPKCSRPFGLNQALLDQPEDLPLSSNPRPPKATLWWLRHPRDISVQWLARTELRLVAARLQKLGFTFSPFAFIFGTTFLFAALASTLQKQEGKQWLQNLSHTKLPGLTENKVNQMSSWVFLESVLSQYINRDNSLLVSTTSLLQDEPYSAELRQVLPQTFTFARAQPATGTVETEGTLAGTELRLVACSASCSATRSTSKRLQIQLSPIWSQHIKKDFLGVFPRRFAPSPRFAEGEPVLSRPPARFLLSEAEHDQDLSSGSPRSAFGGPVLSFAEQELRALVRRTSEAIRGQPELCSGSRGQPELRSSNELSSALRQIGRVNGRFDEGINPLSLARSTERNLNKNRVGRELAFAKPSQPVIDQDTLREPQLEKALIWPWYKIMAYHHPNHLISPTWTEHPITGTKIGQTGCLVNKPTADAASNYSDLFEVACSANRAGGRLSKRLTGTPFRPIGLAPSSQAQLLLSPEGTKSGRVTRKHLLSTDVNTFDNSSEARSSEATKLASQRTVGLGATRLDLGASCLDPEGGNRNSVPATSYAHSSFGRVRPSSSKSQILFGKSKSFDCVTAKEPRPKLGAKSLFAGTKFPLVVPQLHMSVERLRLEDDSIPSKKNSVYSKKEINRNTLSTCVLNIVKKSFYEYGLSIPGPAKAPNWVADQRPDDLDKLVSSKNAGTEFRLVTGRLQKLPTFSKSSVNRKLSLARGMNKSEAFDKPTCQNGVLVSRSAISSSSQAKSILADVSSTDYEVAERLTETSFRQTQALQEAANLNENGRLPRFPRGQVTSSSEKASKPPSLSSIKANGRAAIFRDIAIPKKSFWEYAHSISGYNFPELQDYEIADLFRKSTASTHSKARSMPERLLVLSRPPVRFAEQEPRRRPAEQASATGYGTRLSEIAHRRDKFGKTAQLAITSPANQWFCIDTDQVFLAPYLAKVPPKVLLTASTKTESLIRLQIPSGLTGCRYGEPLEQDLKIRYTPIDLEQESKLKKAFKELGYDYSDYLKQPKDTLPALLLSPSLEEDKQIEQEEAQRLAKEKAAAKAAEKRTQNEKESISDFETKEDFTSLDLDPSGQPELRSAIEVALREGRNDTTNFEEEPLNDEEMEDSRFERLRFTREVESRKEEENCRGLALSVRSQDSTAPVASLAREKQPFRVFGFARAKSNQNVAGTEFRLPPSGAKRGARARYASSDNKITFLLPGISDRKHNFFGQKSFWPTRLFSQEERLVSAHIVSPYIRYDQSNPWLIEVAKRLTGTPFQPQKADILPVVSEMKQTANCKGSPGRLLPSKAEQGLTEGASTPSLALGASRLTLGSPKANPCLAPSGLSKNFAHSSEGRVRPQGGNRNEISAVGSNRNPVPATLASQHNIAGLGSGPPAHLRPLRGQPKLRSGNEQPNDESCKTKDLQNLKNLQTQARLGLVRFVHFPVVETVCSASLVPEQPKSKTNGKKGVLFDEVAERLTGTPFRHEMTNRLHRNPKSEAKSRSYVPTNSDGLTTLASKGPWVTKQANSSAHSLEGGLTEQTVPVTGSVTEYKSVRGAVSKANQINGSDELGQSVTLKVENKNRIYKPDPRLRLTPLESSVSADWRNNQKAEASPFRVTSKEQPRIVLPKLSEQEWQKSLEWQLKSYFLEEETRLKPLAAADPFKTFKVKTIERSLPWLTLERPSFKHFQWPYKTVGGLSVLIGSRSDQLVASQPNEIEVALALAKPRRGLGAQPLTGNTFRPRPQNLRFFAGTDSGSWFVAGTEFRLVAERLSPLRGQPELRSGYQFSIGSAKLLISPEGAKHSQNLGPKGPPSKARLRFCAHETLRARLLRFAEQDERAPLFNYTRIPLASGFTTYSKDRSELSTGSGQLFDVTKKLFSSQDDLNTELLFEPPSTSSWFLIYRLFLALILKEVFKYIYRISLKDFFIRIINSDFGRTITSPEFRQSVQFEPFPEFYRPKNRLKDFIGIKNALLPLSEIIWFLRNNCRSPSGPHGVVLLGPEGVDTTAIAQAVAGEAKVPIIVQSLRALTLTHSHPQKRLEKVLLLARAQSPCVLFFDELDVIGQSREGVIRNTSGDGDSLISLDSSQLVDGTSQLQAHDDQDTSQGRRVDLLLRLLTVMDGLHHLNGVVIITTSKNIATLDPALLRPGRFDRLIHLTLPNHENRIELFKAKTREFGHTAQTPLVLANRNYVPTTISARPVGGNRNSASAIARNASGHTLLLSESELEYLSNQSANMTEPDIVSAINYSALRAIVNETVHTVETLEYGLNCVKALKART